MAHGLTYPAPGPTSQPSLPSSRNLLSSSEERTDGSFEGEEYARMGALNVGGRVGAALRGEEHGGSRADGGLGSNGAGRTGQGMVVVVVLLCSQLRGARLTESKGVTIEVALMARSFRAVIL
eukprot:1150431-Pelagomonas_calceolata.AAC.8